MEQFKRGVKMKLSKRLRFLFSLTALLICLCMGTAAVNADMIYDVQEETTLSEEDAKTYANGKINMATAKSMLEQYVSVISQMAVYSPEELEFVADAMSYQTDLYSNFAQIVGGEPCGKFVSYDNVKVVEMEDAEAVDVTADLHFEKKELKITLHVKCFDVIGAQITSTEFSLADAGEESFGSKLATAGSNTLMGMCVVFFVLIFMSLIISCFGFIPKLKEKFSKQKSEKTETDNVVEASPEISEVLAVEEDNAELIAVIAAAIAASEQTSTDSFVVRSIRRR